MYRFLALHGEDRHIGSCTARPCLPIPRTGTERRVVWALGEATIFTVPGPCWRLSVWPVLMRVISPSAALCYG